MSGSNVERQVILEAQYHARELQMEAIFKEIKDFKVTDLGLSEAEVGLKGSHAKTIKLFTPQSTTQAQILEGSEEEAAKKLVQKLKEEAKVL